MIRKEAIWICSAFRPTRKQQGVQFGLLDILEPEDSHSYHWHYKKSMVVKNNKDSKPFSIPQPLSLCRCLAILPAKLTFPIISTLDSSVFSLPKFLETSQAQ